MIAASFNIWIIILVGFTRKVSLQAFKMCSAQSNLGFTERNKILPNVNYKIITLTSGGLMKCAQHCLKRQRCLSFNYHILSGECQLNNRTVIPTDTQLTPSENYIFSDGSHWPHRLIGACANHYCPLDAYCESADNTGYVCKYSGCLGDPAVINGHFNQPLLSHESGIGTILPYSCDPGYEPGADVICQEDGTWSSGSCDMVSSCSMVKQYRSDSKDGEFWLRLVSFDNYKIRIYCHNMSTTSPVEYITLVHINYGIYPKFSNYFCKRRDGPLHRTCAGQDGEVWFSKIRLNIDTLEVNITDRTFANLTDDELDYGVAKDCYTHHLNNKTRCGTRGRFTIDLRDTGLRVKSGQTWAVKGWGSLLEKIMVEANGTIIRLHCGGFVGWCYPKGGLFLCPYPTCPTGRTK